MHSPKAFYAQRATSSNQSIISSLRATQLIESKSILPAELISTILDLLSVPDLLSFARTSKRIMEMVYEDSRWVQRLRIMGVWNEGEARRWIEETNRINMGDNSNRGLDSEGITNSIPFGSAIEERQWRIHSNKFTPNNSIFTHQTLAGTSYSSDFPSSVVDIKSDPEAHLDILSQAKSIRGFARFEFAKIYASLAPYYLEISRSKDYAELAIFKTYSSPEQQAQILAHILRFSKCDWAMNWKQRIEKLDIVIRTFECIQLRKFQQGYVAKDIGGRMRRYAHILTVLNGGQAAIDSLIQNHPIFTDRRNFLDMSMDYLHQNSTESVSLELFNSFLTNSVKMFNEQSEIIDCVFPQGIDVLQIFLNKFFEEVFAQYIIQLIDRVYERSTVLYVKAVPKLFEQSIRFALSLRPSKNSSHYFSEKLKRTIARIFEPQLDLYLQEELEYFKKTVESEISEWESKLSAQDMTTKSFFMTSFDRQSGKRDFMTSFKKVVMMPIYVLPSVSTFGTKQSLNRNTLRAPLSLASLGSQSPDFNRSNSSTLSLVSPPALQKNSTPNDELSAKAMLMTSWLEGIRSLVSIEVALKFTHAAKASIERATLFVLVSGQGGQKAREQCSVIFVSLVQILGQRHVKPGFDQAVNHLSKYNPREVVGHQHTVVPLVNFLELVNVGDLISQMLDVFYEQQLSANKLTDPNDSFDPAVQAKKHFEKMLDDCVAAGLNRGIDVLMDEIQYLCATVQLPTDYNPSPTSDGNFDLGPSKAAELVVNLVESHTKILEGSTDKNVLEIFNQEVGLRLFSVLCRHLKRQRVSINGAMKLISDMNHYYLYIKTLRNHELLEYFKALKELSQIFLIAPTHAKEIAEVIADKRRFGGLFRAEEVYEFVERRADWYSVKKKVEKAMYGIGCRVM